MNKMFLTAALAAAVSVPAAHAADAVQASLSSDHRLTSAAHVTSAGSMDTVHSPAGLRVIYSNIAYENPKGRYISNTGWTISGPSSLIGEEIWLGAVFTPKSDTTIYEVDAPVGYVTGTMGFVLSLYTDQGGVPGTALASYKVKKMPFFGSCCGMARAFNDTGLPVMGGTPYWVVVSTSPAEADEWAAWNLNDVNQVDLANGAVNTGTGWVPTQFLPGPGFAVFGK